MVDVQVGKIGAIGFVAIVVAFQGGHVGACYEVFEERGSLCFGVVK